MKTLEELEALNMTGSLGEPVHAVRIEDILDTVSSKTVIMKIDVEGYECKVRSVV